MTSFRLRSWPLLPVYFALLALLAGCTTSLAPSPTSVPTLAVTAAPSPAALPTATIPPPPPTTIATTTPVPPIGATATPARPSAASASPVTARTPNREDPPNWDFPLDPPERGSVGTGYLLSGIVRALGTCRSIPGARVILWLANPQGVYDDASRATVVADPDGSYCFESHVPVSYDGVRPHIHMRVTAPGFRPLMTTHLYDTGQHRPTFDLVLAPER